MRPTQAGMLKEQVNTHLELYVNKKSTVDFTFRQREEAGVKQIEDDEADWKQLRDLIEMKFMANPTDMSPKAGEKWLLEVNDVFHLLQANKAKASVQRKVQQFCNQFIPDNLALDKVILHNGLLINSYNREGLIVRYRTKGASRDYPLTSDPAGLNEITYDQIGVKPEDSQFEAFLYEGMRVSPAISLKLTPKSVAAFIYNGPGKS
jgi:hypothetical protein